MNPVEGKGTADASLPWLWVIEYLASYERVNLQLLSGIGRYFMLGIRFLISFTSIFMGLVWGIPVWFLLWRFSWISTSIAQWAWRESQGIDFFEMFGAVVRPCKYKWNHIWCSSRLGLRSHVWVVPKLWRCSRGHPARGIHFCSTYTCIFFLGYAEAISHKLLVGLIWNIC